MTKKSFIHGNLKMSYQEWGNGDDVILCFHGFGRQSGDFQLFTELLQPNQRIIACDLHAHESSSFVKTIPNKPSIRQQDWLNFLDAFFEEKKISECSIIGYSMGGRLALCLWEWKPQAVKNLLLIASDGLKKNLLYSFASGTLLGRKLYRLTIENPNIIFSIAHFLHVTGILHPKLYRFVHLNLDTRAKRQQVYDAWLAYRYFFPDLKKLGKIHSHHTIPLTLIFGKKDSIIRPRLANNLTKHFNTKVEVHLLDAGHRLINPELVQFMRQQNLWPNGNK